MLFFADRLTGSPWGRRLRAMRENAEAVESLGTNVRAESLKVYVIGGAIAAVSGGLLVEFIGAWSPAAWGTGETFIYFVAIIVGGLGNNFGAFFGAFLVLGVFLELPTYLPQIGSANTEESLQSAAIGVLILVFLWWRPQGIFPERTAQAVPAAPRRPRTPVAVTGRLAPGQPLRSRRVAARRRPRTPRRRPAARHARRVRDLQPRLRRRAGGGRAVLRAGPGPGHRA